MAGLPYKFNVGDEVTVVSMSRHQGLTGKIVKRGRQRVKGVGWLEAALGNIPPENVYYVVFEKGGGKHVFGEGNLIPPSK